MPRMSKKRKEEWAFFLNERNRNHLQSSLPQVPPHLQAEFPGYDHRVPAVSLQAGEAMKPDNTQETIYVGLDTGLPALPAISPVPAENGTFPRPPSCSMRCC